MLSNRQASSLQAAADQLARVSVANLDRISLIDNEERVRSLINGYKVIRSFVDKALTWRRVLDEGPSNMFIESVSAASNSLADLSESTDGDYARKFDAVEGALVNALTKIGSAGGVVASMMVFAQENDPAEIVAGIVGAQNTAIESIEKKAKEAIGESQNLLSGAALKFAEDAFVDKTDRERRTVIFWGCGAAITFAVVVVSLIGFARPDWLWGWFDLGATDLANLGIPNFTETHLRFPAPSEIEAIVSAAVWVYTIKSLVKVAWILSFGIVGLFCLRMLRAHKEIRERSLHRARLLAAFNSLTGSLGGDERAVVIARLVDEIATFGETGLVAGHDQGGSGPGWVQSMLSRASQGKE